MTIQQAFTMILPVLQTHCLLKIMSVIEFTNLFHTDSNICIGCCNSFTGLFEAKEIVLYFNALYLTFCLSLSE